MKFDVHFPDSEYPNESEELFKRRFLSSLTDSFQDSRNHNRISAAVLHVRSGMRKTLLARIAFWRPLTLQNFPQKVQWAAQVLSERGYEWKLDWFRDRDNGNRYPVIFVAFPSGCFDPAQIAAFLRPSVSPPLTVPALEHAKMHTKVRAKVSRGSHLKLVWDRDASASSLADKRTATR